MQSELQKVPKKKVKVSISTDLKKYILSVLKYGEKNQVRKSTKSTRFFEKVQKSTNLSYFEFLTFNLNLSFKLCRFICNLSF